MGKRFSGYVTSRYRDAYRRGYVRRFYISLGVILLVFVAGIFDQAQHADAQTPCPCHIFSSIPSSPIIANDGTGLALGVRFKPRVSGYITGIRFYKDVSMTDTHTGDLWGPNGSLLASGTFTGETASGWQDMQFATPVPVTAGSMYTASYYTPSGKYVASSGYFASAVDNYPLLAPDNTTVFNAGYRGNGVYNSGSDAYPASTFGSANYWADVTFRQIISSTVPEVASVAPSSGQTGISPGVDATATLSQSLDSASVSASTVALMDAQGNSVSSTISYDDSSKTITIHPNALLQENATYTASLLGGVSGLTNLDGGHLAATYQWSFSVGTDQCPCSVWNESRPTNNPLVLTGSGGKTLGVKVHATEAGYIKAVRFYKSLTDTSAVHTVRVWTTGGTLLATGVSSHETSAGWQEVHLASGAAIAKNTDYVISYYSPANTHVYSLDALSSEAGTGSVRIDANGSSFDSGDVFPHSTTVTDAKSNWWVDPVFALRDTYTEPFTVGATQPKSGAYGVDASTPITFTMSNPVNASTISSAVVVKNASGITVAGTVSYDDTSRAITFTPSASLSTQVRYTATIAGSVADVYGTALGAPYSFTFTTGAAPSTDVNQGMGGPVLVLTSSANPYDTYLAEMLRSEGITYFTVQDIATISAATLNQYKLVLLGKSSLSAGQVASLEAWVGAGGNLIAMQPDKQLASFMGLTDKNQTVGEGYIKVDASQSPGSGITTATMQYHGTADRYQNNSAQTVATLYTDATTPTADPAVAQKTVGSGHVAAFLYDLPHSIASLHQGNITWARQERDGITPIRPNDLFFGGSSTDYLNVTKAYIPQADEQQRLLVNMMLTMTRDSSPLPRFWILPHGYKAAVVMAGDDHSTASGTYAAADEHLRNSNTNCSVADWECARSGSFIYTTSGLTSSQANQIHALGFSVGVHTSSSCGNYASYANLNADYTSQIAAFQAKYTGLPAQHTDRTHCYAWADWDSVPKVDVAQGIHYNMNYEWYPESWTGTANAGYLTGSGLNMRLTDAGGHLLDVYQGVTDLDYENDPTSTSMNADFDNAVGSNEYYGIFGTHYDYTNDYDSKLITAALARNIPMITPEQAFTWKNALGSSNFSNITTTNSQLSFTANVAQGGSGAQAMVPVSAGNGNIMGITLADHAVDYTTSTVKGVTYAVFDALPGNYKVQYGIPPTGETAVPSGSISSSSSGASSIATTRSFASISQSTPFSSEGAKTVAPSSSTTDQQSQIAKKVVSQHETTPSAASFLAQIGLIIMAIVAIGGILFGVWHFRLQHLFK